MDRAFLRVHPPPGSTPSEEELNEAGLTEAESTKPGLSPLSGPMMGGTLLKIFTFVPGRGSLPVPIRRGR